MSVRRISVREARANFADLLAGVHYTQEAVMVERKGKPFAAVVSPEQFQSLQKQQEAAASRLRKVAEGNVDKDLDQVLAEVTKEVEAVRQARYEKQKKTKGGR
jgi:prevent-host-death family protein